MYILSVTDPGIVMWAPIGQWGGARRITVGIPRFFFFFFVRIGPFWGSMPEVPPLDLPMLPFKSYRDREKPCDRYKL